MVHARTPSILCLQKFVTSSADQLMSADPLPLLHEFSRINKLEAYTCVYLFSVEILPLKYLPMTGQIQKSISGYLLVKLCKLKFLMVFHCINCRIQSCTKLLCFWFHESLLFHIFFPLSSKIKK